jgi:hypothetical protein
MREFKDAVTGKNKDDDDLDSLEAPPPSPADRVTNTSATAQKGDETPASTPKAAS